MCGLVIGLHGRNIKSLKQISKAEIIIEGNRFGPDKQVCKITGKSVRFMFSLNVNLLFIGSQMAVDIALQTLRERYPLKLFPELTLQYVSVVPVLNLRDCSFVCFLVLVSIYLLICFNFS